MMIRPIRATASILMPALVEPTFTLEQTKSVSARAWGDGPQQQLIPPGKPFVPMQKNRR